jgi:hypothetical protein
VARITPRSSFLTIAHHPIGLANRGEIRPVPTVEEGAPSCRSPPTTHSDLFAARPALAKSTKVALFGPRCSRELPRLVNS